MLFSSKKDDPNPDKEEDEEAKPERVFQRTAIRKVLPEAIERSGEGGFEFSQRSLYYRVRILTKGILPTEPTYNYFCSILTDYENEYGEIVRLIRDTRGVYVEPHGGDLTSMGTLTVGAYERPLGGIPMSYFSKRKTWFRLCGNRDFSTVGIVSRHRPKAIARARLGT